MQRISVFSLSHCGEDVSNAVSVESHPLTVMLDKVLSPWRMHARIIDVSADQPQQVSRFPLMRVMAAAFEASWCVKTLRH